MTDAVTVDGDGAGGPANAHEWALQAVRDRTEANPDTEHSVDHRGDLWTSRQRLTRDGKKFSVPYDADEVDQAIDDLVDAGEVFDWLGWLCPVEDEHLKAIIEAERNSDVTRKILVGRLNELRQQQRASEQDDDQPSDFQEADSDE